MRVSLHRVETAIVRPRSVGRERFTAKTPRAPRKWANLRLGDPGIKQPCKGATLWFFVVKSECLVRRLRRGRDRWLMPIEYRSHRKGREGRKEEFRQNHGSDGTGIHDGLLSGQDGLHLLGWHKPVTRLQIVRLSFLYSYLCVLGVLCGEEREHL